ncbi:hypothetical protein [Halomonas huangheensis]|uniref:DUF1127 domain-containing protein n=1 Tax=Halomonas huangheensis TaxID=1178482 RepID=W1N2F5_9GAMM|nr:hypothetical protein [Halomonas huangheensis]ALM52408.1 hypothetical protein AR456_09045 [Halomonas huangheensis]ERL49160.1 hypothetical protein BJB45_07755 [Halomonas huangheensis]
MQPNINQSAKATAGKPPIEHQKPLNRMPEVIMPAMPPLGLIMAIENWVKRRVVAWRGRRQQRAAAREAGNLDHRMRRDIGIDQ